MKNYPFSNKNACFIADQTTANYFIGGSLEEGYLVLTDQKTCFIDARSYFGVKDSFEKKGVEVRLLNTVADVKDFLTEKGTQNVFIDFSKTSVKQYFEIQSWGFCVNDCEQTLAKMRAKKNPQEIECIVKACEIAQNALTKSIGFIKAGISELELKERIEKLVLEFGGEGVSFDTIVAFGKNSAVPHHKSCDDTLKENQAVLIDMGARYKGYCSDITRTFFFGKPDKEFIDCYSAVYKANELAKENIKCGTTTDKADAFSRDYLKAKGYGEYFTHSLGHGIGLEVHEYPTLSYRKKDCLEENMVFSIEPGVYMQDKFGIRIEDTVLLTKDGVKRLFTDSKELIIIN